MLLNFLKLYWLDIISSGAGEILIILLLLFILIRIRKSSSPCKEVIYSKQFDGFCEIIEWMEKVIFYLDNYNHYYFKFSKGLNLNGDEIDKEVKNFIRNNFGKDYDFKYLNYIRRTELFLKWGRVLPQSLFEPFNKYIKSIPAEKMHNREETMSLIKSLEKKEEIFYQCAIKYFYGKNIMKSNRKELKLERFNERDKRTS